MHPILSLTLLMLPACKDGGKGPGGDSGGDGPGSVEITVTMSEIVPTVATVTFPTDGLTDGVITMVPTEGDALSVQADVTDGNTVVLGMKPGTTYTLQLEANGGDVLSNEVDVTTGNLPNDLPGLFPDEEVSGDHSGGYIVTSFVNPPTALVMDRDGDIVWWYQPDGLLQLGRVRFSVDGSRVMMADINLEGRGTSEMVSVNLDGSGETRLDVPYRHHDFVEHDDGTLAFIAHDPRTVGADDILGDQIIEVAPDGTQTQVYTIWDNHEAGAGKGSGGPGGIAGWAHANALDWYPDRNQYLMSFLHMEGVAAIDRDSGMEAWLVGGSEATISGPDSPLEFHGGQHGMQLFDDDRMLLFVNGQGNQARMVELQLDIDGGSFTELDRYQPGLGTPILGDVQRLDNGHTLVIFSYNGEVHELDENGELTWRLSASLGGAMSYLTWLETLPNGG